MTDIEIWKDIKDYEGLYQVSNYGRVKSLGNGKTHKTTRIMKINKQKNGYCRVILTKDGVEKNKSVHRLVATAFLENPENLPCVNHKDENPSNNNVSNLEFCDQKYNINYGNRNKKVSNKMTNGKLSKPVLQFTPTGDFIREWPSTREIERQLGFDSSAVGRCCVGKQKTSYGFCWMYKYK